MVISPAALQKVDPDTDLHALGADLAAPHDERQAKVELEARDGMRVHEAHAGGDARRAADQVADGVGEAARDGGGRHVGARLPVPLPALLVSASSRLQGDEAAGVGEELHAQGRVGTAVGEGEEEVEAAGGEDVAADGVGAVVGAEAA
ncbi:hypothetical protein BN1723_003729 [Verticillium longisporum]|uniref:Uncharacterized protein n=1 Tax=Verticillium longisporum TaxID=100787 RepID=A0A0G4MA31_VERLO|nr:hypothetical protein BN1723_003729 [Verticillium longisporum]